MSAEAWQAQAACLGADTDLFFPDERDTETRDRALDICSACPVTSECLAWALATEGRRYYKNRHGIWGGTTPSRRGRIYAKTLLEEK